MKAIRIGGDCDTVAAMAGGIAYAYYRTLPRKIVRHCLDVSGNELSAKGIEFHYRFDPYCENLF